MTALWECGEACCKLHSGTKCPRECHQAPRNPSGDFPMQWQTPTAIDFRFGFEITMYVANR
jgi:coenzyme PQQ precursor peptide PqqA